MKKLVLFAAIAVAISFASCSNKQAETTTPEAEGTEVAAPETAPVQEEAPAPVDTAAQAQETPAAE